MGRVLSRLFTGEERQDVARRRRDDDAIGFPSVVDLCRVLTKQLSNKN